MSAQPAIHSVELDENEMLDPDTSAAVMRWMETATAPEGVDPEQWEHWLDDGCRGPIKAGDVVLTPAMLGAWARTGNLR